MRVNIADLVPGQKIYDKDLTDSYKVYNKAEMKDGKLQIEVTTSGDYIWFFNEEDILWNNPERTDE